MLSGIMEASLRGAWAAVAGVTLGLALFFHLLGAQPRYVIPLALDSGTVRGRTCRQPDATATLEILSATTFRLNGRLGTLEGLPNLMRTRFRNRLRQQVYIQSPGSIRYREFLRIAALARSGGFTTLTFGLPKECEARAFWILE
jgi:hypothetical protein